MKTAVNVFDFVDAFKNRNRETNFSRAALVTLFDYLEDYEQSSGEELELDVIALCCDFSENDAFEIAEFYNLDLGEYAGADTVMDEDARQAILSIVRDFLEDEGMLVGLTDNDTFVYRNL